MDVILSQARASDVEIGGCCTPPCENGTSTLRNRPGHHSTMVHYRRQDPTTRRRRIVTNRSAFEFGESSASTKSPAAGRREQLRAARRGTKAYGSAVRRRLRGRWFQLVPVRRSQLAVAVIVPGALALCLVAAGYAAVQWAPLASHPEVARPFRLDVAGNLADWVGSQFLLLGAGCSFLIYQMRRYRADDFQGHYRLWRPIILLFLVAALDAVVRVRDALGGAIDLIQGETIVMAGSDIVRLAMLIGGAALAIPLIREMRRIAIANVIVVVALTSLAVPTLLRLGVAGEVDQVDALLVAGSARMVGRTLLLVAAIVYLRKVFREVRGLDVDQPSTAEAATRQQRKQAALRTVDEDDEDYLTTSGIPIDPRQWFRRGREDVEPQSEAEQDEDDAAPTRRGRLRGWLPRIGRRTKDELNDEELEADAELEDEEFSGDDDPSDAEEQWDDEEQWESEDGSAESEEAGDTDEPDAPTRKRRGLKLPGLPRPRLRLPRARRLRLPQWRLPSVRLPRPRMPKASLPRLPLASLRMPLPSGKDAAGEGTESSKPRAASERPIGGEPAEPRRRVSVLSRVKEIRPWKRRTSQPEDATHGSRPAHEHAKRDTAAARQPVQFGSDEHEELDAGDVDWSKLSKSERRRLRKTLRRQQDAA